MGRHVLMVTGTVLLAVLAWREWASSQWMTQSGETGEPRRRPLPAGDVDSERGAEPVAEPSEADVEQPTSFCHLCVLEDSPGYLKQYLDEPGWDEFVEEARRGAERGDPEAQYQLGMAYLYGAAVAEDRQRAMKLFALAAAAQHPKASGWHANDLYNQHMEKTGNQFGTPEARRFMKIAADGGVTSAMALLAAYHEHVEDYAEAARYHRKAADAGAICARYSLSMLYLDGRGVTKDVKHAIELLKADTECSNPIFELADIYTQGKYVPKDYGAAVAAIAHGTLPGHKARAAKLYETGGPGLKADKARALTLYREAVEAGGELFEADVKRLEARRD